MSKLAAGRGVAVDSQPGLGAPVLALVVAKHGEAALHGADDSALPRGEPVGYAVEMSLLHILPLAVAAHASFTRIPSGNGFGTLVYDVSQARVVDLREHVYQSVDSGVATR